MWLVTGLDDKGLAAGVRGARRAPPARRVRRRRAGAVPWRSCRWQSHEPRSPSTGPTESAARRARRRGRRVLLRARADRRALPAPARARGRARRDRRGRRGGRGGPRDPALAAARAARSRCSWRSSTRSSTRRGDTLLVRGGELLGRRIDITLEATLYGALTGLRVVVIVVALGLLSAAVDPDELLRLVPARLLPLGAHRVAGQPPGAGARPRRHAHGRRRALPPASAGPARGGARGARRRARPVGRRGGGARGARLCARRPPAAQAAAVVAARPALRRRRARYRLRRGGGGGRGRRRGRALSDASRWHGTARSGRSAARSCCSALAPFAGRAARLGVGGAR